MQMLTKITNNICDTALLKARNIVDVYDNCIPHTELKSDTLKCLKEIKDGLLDFSNSRELTKTANDKIKRSITQIDYYMSIIRNKEEDDNEE